MKYERDARAEVNAKLICLKRIRDARLHYEASHEKGNFKIKKISKTRERSV